MHPSHATTATSKDPPPRRHARVAAAGFVIVACELLLWGLVKAGVNVSLSIGLSLAGCTIALARRWLWQRGRLLGTALFPAAHKLGARAIRRLSRRKTWQFSLRTLLLFVLVASIAMSWIAVRMERARRQAKAVKGISGRPSYRPNEPPVPRWLAELLGKDFFCEVVAANIAHDQTMSSLRDLPGLERLSIDYMACTDASMTHLRGLKRLRELSITAFQFISWRSDAQPRITDEGLRHLSGLRSLERLDIQSPVITDVGVENLKGLTQLRSLAFYSPKITDAGLAHLNGLSRLEYLELSGSQVTDAGLGQLKGLAQLRYVYLYGTKVTDQGVKDLRQALPGCEIMK